MLSKPQLTLRSEQLMVNYKLHPLLRPVAVRALVTRPNFRRHCCLPSSAACGTIAFADSFSLCRSASRHAARNAMAQDRPATSEAEIRAKAQQHGVSLTPVHRDFGVVVEGLDMTKPLSPEHQSLVLDLWKHHLLLLFRGTYLDPAAQERVLRYLPHDAKALDERRFCNNYFQPRVPSNPVLAVRGHNVTLERHEGLTHEQLKTCKLGGAPFDESRLWHMDMSDTPIPPEVSAIYMVRPSPDGSDDTIFASTETMFENLDDATKQQILPLRTVNRKASEVMAGAIMNWEGTRRLDDMDEKLKLAADKGIVIEPPPNPFVIKDPDNSRPAVLISAQRMYQFEGMSRPDSLDLLEKVLSHGTADSEVYKHKWQPNDYAVWANRRLIHTASPGKGYTHTEDQMRLYHLVFLDTDKPVLAAA